jgi:transposase
LSWLAGFGQLVRVGVEGTGAYGAALSRFLRSEGVEVVEVDRPDRKIRRAKGKSDRSPPTPRRWRRCPAGLLAFRKAETGGWRQSGRCA